LRDCSKFQGENKVAKVSAKLRGRFRHTNVTVLLLPPRRVILNFALDPECNRSVFPDATQGEFLRLSSDFHLANPLRKFRRRDVSVPRGFLMRTWVRVAAMPLRYSISFARTISTRSTS
jgi:hypothetical protein